MKTTIEIEDDLFHSAKAMAAQRRTTLRAMVEHALRRELHHHTYGEQSNTDLLTTDEDGITCLRPRGKSVSSEVIYELMEREGI